jgi:hypothetical protein
VIYVRKITNALTKRPSLLTGTKVNWTLGAAPPRALDLAEVQGEGELFLIRQHLFADYDHRVLIHRGLHRLRYFRRQRATATDASELCGEFLADRSNRDVHGYLLRPNRGSDDSFIAKPG